MTAFEDFDRRSGIGASEVSGLIGQSPWATPAGIWMEKVGMTTGRPSSGSMRTGTALEAALLAIAADLADVRLKRNRTTFVHAAWPEVPLFATPDGFTPRRAGVVEIKLVGYRGSDWSDGPPPYVETQVQAQMAVHGRATFALVGALIGSEVRTFEVPRDPVLIEAIETDVRDFWASFVGPEVAPPVETPADRWAMARALAGRAVTREERAADDLEEVTAARLLALRATADEMDAEENLLRLALAESSVEVDLVGNGWRGAWTSRRHIDWAAVAKDLGARPADIEARSSTSRVFSFRRPREAA